MKFPGIEKFLVRYRGHGATAGIDPFGLYIPPCAYAEMQILEAAIKGVNTLDDRKLDVRYGGRQHQIRHARRMD